MRGAFAYVEKLNTAAGSIRRALGRWALARLAAILLCCTMVALLATPRGPLSDAPIPERAGAAVLLLLVGWFTVRDLGRIARPAVFKHLPDQTSGPADYLLRAVTFIAVVAGGLHIAGVSLPTIAATGTVGAVVLGLAAQQALGNLMAGIVLLGVHPYHVGEKVRLQGGLLGGVLEGRVATMGLFYTRVRNGENHVHIPNAQLLNATVTPIREPIGVDVRVHLAPGVMTTDVQTALRRITTPTRSVPHVDLEEVEESGAVVRITVVPQRAADGSKLADEVLQAMEPITGISPE